MVVYIYNPSSGSRVERQADPGVLWPVSLTISMSYQFNERSYLTRFDGEKLRTHMYMHPYTQMHKPTWLYMHSLAFKENLIFLNASFNQCSQGYSFTCPKLPFPFFHALVQVLSVSNAVPFSLFTSKSWASFELNSSLIGLPNSVLTHLSFLSCFTDQAQTIRDTWY